MKLIPQPEFSGHLHREKHRALEDTYTFEERELILGSLSKAFPALQDLHSYILLLPTKGTTARSRCMLVGLQRGQVLPRRLAVLPCCPIWHQPLTSCPGTARQ